MIALLGKTTFAFIPALVSTLAGVGQARHGSHLRPAQHLAEPRRVTGVAVTSSIATAHFHTLARHGYATAAALSGGLQ
jgi:hypothetical protein